MAHSLPKFQIALVGAGPIGIELAVALKQAGMNSATSHVHVPKILRAITGRSYDLPVLDPGSPPSETR